jgi:hypothetical protein
MSVASVSPEYYDGMMKHSENEIGGNLFDEIQTTFQSAGAEAALARLAERLKTGERYAELFDARLMQIRWQNGLPVAQSVSLEKLAEPLRGQIEKAYLEACKEAGWGLLGQRRVREAWRFLRPTGEQAAVATALTGIAPDEQNLEQLIEVALHEGVAPELGFKLVLEQYGVCNAISAMETVMTQFALPTRQAAAAMLIRELHHEMLESVQEDITKREGSSPVQSSLATLLSGRDWLVADGRYHADVSHLAAVVRAGRIVVDSDVLRLALDLTEYGGGLHPDHQYAGDEPFANFYPTHQLFFAAQLGMQIDEALAYFRGRAEELLVGPDGALAAEVYVGLLARLKRYREAIEVTLQFLPPSRPVTGFSPSLRELCKLAGDSTAVLERSRSENDPIGFAAALIGDSGNDAVRPKIHR